MKACRMRVLAWIGCAALFSLVAPISAAHAVAGTGAIESTGPAPFEPLRYEGPRISLADALRLTLQNEPQILIKEQEAAEKGGTYQEASGAFDASFQGTLAYEYIQKPLLQSDIEKQRDARLRLEERANDKRKEISVHEVRIQELEAARAVVVADGDLSTVTFSDATDMATWLVFRATYEAADATTKDLVKQSILQWIDEGIKASREALDKDWPDNCPDYLEGESDEDTGLRCQLKFLEDSREALGDFPTSEKSYRGSLDVKVTKRYRNGVTFSPYFRLNGSGDNYQDKPVNALMGGKGNVDKYDSQIGFTVTTPLRRGRGEEVATAQERAANFNYQAARLRVTHQAAQSVRDTINDYWNLVGAQENLKVQEALLALNEEILQVTKDRIEADEMPRAELPRALARVAEARARVEQGRRSVHEARIRLAQTIGLKADDVARVPLAADSFPGEPKEADLGRLDVAKLVEAALEGRMDYRAAKLAEEAGVALVVEARDGLRARVDLETELWYQTAKKHSAVIPGIFGTLIGRWGGPSIRMTLSWDAPIENNTAEGRLAQQQALYSRQRITTADLHRVLEANIALAVGTIREVVAQHANYVSAGQYYKESVAAEKEKLRLGSTTLIDVLTTIQSQFSAEQQIIQAAKAYAQLVAQLRYESGLLVKATEEGHELVVADVVSLPTSR